MRNKSKGLKLADKITFSYLTYHILMVVLILLFVSVEIMRIQTSFEKQYRKDAEESILNLNERILQAQDALTLAMYGENVQMLRGRKGHLTVYEETNLELKIKNELTVLASQYQYVKDMGMYIPEYKMWIDARTWFEKKEEPSWTMKKGSLQIENGEIYFWTGIQDKHKSIEGYVWLDKEAIYELLENSIDEKVAMDIYIDNQCLTDNKVEGYHEIRVKSDIYPIEIRYYVPADMLSFKNEVYIVGILSVVVLVITALIFSSYLNREIHKPINNLVQFMESIKEENYKEQLEPCGKEEFHYVTLEFNKMKEYLEEYIEHKYEQELVMKQMELDHLQEQIKAHFLYNCFANISNLCKTYDVEKAEELSAALSKYYNYITRTNTDLIFLKEEYNHMKTYLTIQKIRFGNRVEIEVEELPANRGDIEVPRLILQPIVENSYKYCFEHVAEDALLRIYVKEEEEILKVIIEDSGYEMNDDTVKRIEAALNKGKGALSGLGNLQKRLKFIHPGNRIEVEKSELGGVKSTVIIHMKEE